MSLRSSLLTRRIFGFARQALPRMSATEREALEAGDVWFEAELFSGNPDWEHFLELPRAALSDEEEAFLKGPVDDLCGMVDDWRINWELGDLPREVWSFLREKRFFGMIIPKQYGGLGFSPYAHSEIVRRISTRSIVAAVTVMVPNSLGPGELLVQFGTQAQRDYWLPRLADGREIPCFGLTSPEAGSDAASMLDRGVVCRGVYQGQEVLGIRLNWHKRYITLAPVATLLGLAFKLYDPDHLIGDKDEVGITVALVPTDTPGVEIGRRHLPAGQKFQNGPTSGRDVFIPLDHVIGGSERAGQGWKMLMSALAAGRGISLPSQAAAAAAFVARTSGAYARIRQQFGLPIGRFEGIREPLARMAATAYLIDAARRLTCAGLNQGRHAAVIAAIMKAQATERMRAVVNDAMDIHGGKAVIDGPRNYLGALYRAVPVAITVEGANILTRNLIIFGQGSIRCHPFLLEEMTALEKSDPADGLEAFDRVFWRHLRHAGVTLWRALARGWTGGAAAPAPHAGPVTRYFKQLGRYSAALALTAECAFLTLGGSLKRKEAISARLGDILAELYLLSAVLKRFDEDNHPESDLPLVSWCMERGCQTIETRLDEVLANLPNRWAAAVLRLVLHPFGRRRRGPADAVSSQCADVLLEPSAARERLTTGVFVGAPSEPVGQLEEAFRLVIDTADLARKLKEARIADWRTAVANGLLSPAEGERMRQAEEAVAAVIAVDDFIPSELAALASAAPPQGGNEKLRYYAPPQAKAAAE